VFGSKSHHWNILADKSHQNIWFAISIFLKHKANRIKKDYITIFSFYASVESILFDIFYHSLAFLSVFYKKSSRVNYVIIDVLFWRTTIDKLCQFFMKVYVSQHISMFYENEFRYYEENVSALSRTKKNRIHILCHYWMIIHFLNWVLFLELWVERR